MKLLGQILKLFGHIFSPIIMKLLGQILEKKNVYALEATFLRPIIMKLGQNVCLDEI